MVIDTRGRLADLIILMAALEPGKHDHFINVLKPSDDRPVLSALPTQNSLTEEGKDVEVNLPQKKVFESEASKTQVKKMNYLFVRGTYIDFFILSQGYKKHKKVPQ